MLHIRPPKPSLAAFGAIWAGQICSLIGSSTAQFALVWWLTKFTGSATVLATATIAAIVPGIALGPIAGAYVDRWSRRLVMIAADGAGALSALWLAYLFWSDSLQVWHVYIVMLVRSLAGSFHWPAMQASTSLMVPKEHLTRVAGLNQTMHGLMDIVSPPLGALLVGLLPLHDIMLIDVGTAMMAILPLLFVYVPQPVDHLRPSDATGKRPSVWADLLAGLRYVRGWRGLQWLIAMAMIINFLLTPGGSLLPLLVTHHFRGEAIQLASLNSAWGIGVVLGGLFLGVWGGFRKRIHTSMMGLSLMGFGFFAIGIAPATAFWLAVVANFVAGFMNPITNGPIFAVMQVAVAPEMQGRVFTLMSSLCMAMSPLGLAVAGPLADRIGVQPWFMMGGAFCILMGTASFFVPAIARLEDACERHGALDGSQIPPRAETATA
ncbi:MAG: MFS transporter [Anaerolineae bacterium]|nr:MFS transporter [Anaerolineae bacterium]MDW8100792.1 MFS transporter [Anaerolineae bacterium]